MKGLSVILSVGLLVGSSQLALQLRKAGMLPSQKEEAVSKEYARNQAAKNFFRKI